MSSSPEHFAAAYEGAMASLDGGQRWAVDVLLDATAMARFQPATVQRRLQSAFRREAESVNRTLAGGDASA